MTIREIAQRAGVSSAAVSRYLNNGSLSPEKRERIRQVVEETGYKPSAFAQMLRTQKTLQVGVIIPRMDSDAVSRVTQGICDVLDEAGYLFLLANSAGDEKRELDYLRFLTSSQMAGILYLAGPLPAAHRALLDRAKIPIVILGQRMRGVSCVYHDDFHAAKELTGEMIAKGRRHIAFIGVSDADEAAGMQRRLGYEAAIREAGLEINPALMRSGDFHRTDGDRLMREILDGKNPVDGLFCATDTIAVGAMEALEARGISVPAQMSVVGIGNSQLSDVIRPRLTTAHYYYENSGAEAARLLLQMVDNPEFPRKQVILDYEIVQRESV